MANIIKCFRFLKFNIHNYNQIANYVNNIGKKPGQLRIYSFIKKLNYFPLGVLYLHSANLVRNNENFFPMKKVCVIFVEKSFN
ncbi:hypothetical protein RhiirC2_738250 [Rhizophagus irregularis]|uniref:Uncharacterized protein n=1 Tax=Rhizophagus irregularis TaxID=588596 RepID=A0A2N1NLG6_9GLOM|nr:hypothetical protein RhiirC2_738250 [Rhizophagus irregularis]